MAASCASEVFTPLGYLFLSSSARTVRPVVVAVAAISWTMVLKLRRGFPRQLSVIKEKAIRFCAAPSTYGWSCWPWCWKYPRRRRGGGEVGRARRWTWRRHPWPWWPAGYRPVTTLPTMLIPVAGALLSILYVGGGLFQVPAEARIPYSEAVVPAGNGPRDSLQWSSRRRSSSCSRCGAAGLPCPVVLRPEWVLAIRPWPPLRAAPPQPVPGSVLLVPAQQPAGHVLHIVDDALGEAAVGRCHFRPMRHGGGVWMTTGSTVAEPAR